MVVTDPNVELWFEDEAHIGRNTTVTRMWAPRDEQPKLLSAATRQKVGMLGVVNPYVRRIILVILRTHSMERHLKGLPKLPAKYLADKEDEIN